MSKQKNYINGAWLNRVNGYDLVNMDFTQEFLRNLAALPMNEKGIRRVTFGSQQKDPNKWSIYENDYKSRNQVANASPDNDSDQLPF